MVQGVESVCFNFIWRDNPFSWVESLSTVEKSIFSELFYRVGAVVISGRGRVWRLCSPKDIGQFMDTCFCVAQPGVGDCYWHLVARDAASHPPVNRTDTFPHSK